MKFTLLVLVLSLSGCTTLTYREGDAEFSRTSFGTTTQIPDIEITISKEGRRLRMQGYQSDQVEALGTVAREAARGAMQGASPLP